MKKFEIGVYKTYVGTFETIYYVEKVTEKTVTITIHKGGKYEKTKRCKIVNNGNNQCCEFDGMVFESDNDIFTDNNTHFHNEEIKENKVWLQWIGWKKAIPASELKSGMVTIWNGGYTETVKSVELTKSGKSVKCIIIDNNSGKEYDRTLRINTLVAVEEKQENKEDTKVKETMQYEGKNSENKNVGKIELKTEESQKQERIYYNIDEKTAKIAKEMNSFSDYKKGTATEAYKNYCNKAYDILDKIKAEKPEQAGHAANKVDYYCRKLAEYYNDYYRNEASCPSVMICGSENFPVKKKEKQNIHRETLYNTWKYLENYVEKIEDILTNEQPIKSNDSDAVEKLTAKIKRLEKEHKMHIECNRYYKKNGTLKGFDGLEKKEANEIEDFVKRNPAFPPFITYNETSNIRHYKERLEKLIKEKEVGTTEQVETDAKRNKLFTVIENKEIMRLQILFDSVPPAATRDILKSNGFRWSPKNKAWQRQLTNNTRFVYKNIKEKLKDAMLK